MPWCATWGTAATPLWWILPLIGVVVIALMFVVCFRGFCGRLGCMGGCRCKPDQAKSEPVAGSGRPT